MIEIIGTARRRGSSRRRPAGSVPARPAGRHRLRSALAAVAVVAGILGLAGCGGLIGSYLNTEQALKDAGFQSVGVHFHFSKSGDRVAADVSVAAPPSDRDVRDVATIVWNHVHQRFSLLTVSVKGTGSGAGQVAKQTYTFSQLEALLGTRDPSWNQNTISQSAEHLGFVALGGVLVVTAVIAVIAVPVARRRRRQAQATGRGAWGRPTGVPLWPPPTGPPAGWSPSAAGWSPSAPDGSPDHSRPGPGAGAAPGPGAAAGPGLEAAAPWPAGGSPSSTSASAPRPASPAWSPSPEARPASSPSPQAPPPGASAPEAPPASSPSPEAPPPGASVPRATPPTPPAWPSPPTASSAADDGGWGPPGAPD